MNDAMMVVGLVLIFVGLIVCLDDVLRRPQPSMSDQWVIGIGLELLGIAIGS